MKTDVEIAQEAEMQHISKIAAVLDINEDDLEMYGKYKAKISLDVFFSGGSIALFDAGKQGILFFFFEYREFCGVDTADFDFVCGHECEPPKKCYSKFVQKKVEIYTVEFF